MDAGNPVYFLWRRNGEEELSCFVLLPLLLGQLKGVISTGWNSVSPQKPNPDLLEVALLDRFLLVTFDLGGLMEEEW